MAGTTGSRAGPANDRLTGGTGADEFVFNEAAGIGNVDTITDFAHGVDKIALDGIVFAAIGKSLAAGEFRLGTVAKDANDHILYNHANGYLAYDADGKGGAGPALFAVIANHAALTAHDFLVI